MFLAAIGFLMASLVSVSPASPVREKWIIDSAQKDQWEEILRKAGMTSEYAQNVLLQYSLVEIDFGDEVSASPCPMPIKRLERQPRCLYESDAVTVYYPPSPRVRHHIWIVLNRPVDRFGDVTSKEMIQMQAMVNQIVGFLRNNFGLTALIAHWNRPQSGHLDQRFIIEVIPNRLDSLQEHNLKDKVWANSYLLFRNTFSQPQLSLEYDEVDIDFWKGALSGDLPEPFSKANDPDPVEPWVQVQTHRNEAAAALVDNLHSLMVDKGLKVERIPSSDVIQPDTLVVPKNGCAFCIDKVIQSQKIHESKYCWVLFNFKPAVPNAHFLIVPKRHIHSTDRLSEEEICDMHEQAKTLTEILAKREGREDVIMYTQDGLQVGQTVKHAHMHVLLTPDPLRYTFFSLNYDKEKTLTVEELEAVRKELSF